jgi:hypothetical protein
MNAKRFLMNSGDRTYGPYDLQTLAAFVAQKRLAHQTLVAPEGSHDFRPALQYPELRRLFGGAAAASPEAPPASRAGKEAEGQAHLVVFARESEATGRAVQILLKEPSCHELSATCVLVRLPCTADELRDRISKQLPSTERALVLTVAGCAVASHGIGLAEHEDIRTLIGNQLHGGRLS